MSTGSFTLQRDIQVAFSLLMRVVQVLETDLVSASQIILSYEISHGLESLRIILSYLRINARPHIRRACDQRRGQVMVDCVSPFRMYVS